MDSRALVEEYGDMVWRLALARTGSRPDAEDLFQDVFLRAIQHTDQLRSRDHAKAWLIRCTLNRSKSLFTSAWRRHAVPLEEAAAEPVTAEESQVWSAVLALPKPYRTAIHLHYYEDLTVAQIAQLTHSREGTVKSWLHRGRAMLKGALEDEIP